ncbi:hypothetical protein I553_0264 [Mycobacterium xenopi 4042]|uniref:Uncharacterized protein n=1 Tax=Mycobacterium xenopi 4042 TaxID=1299334 RepID=X7YLH4_MYCXE|nr:hypothetical protein I553_0264 [Mycobacterium xenopi 4042]
MSLPLRPQVLIGHAPPPHLDSLIVNVATVLMCYAAISFRTSDRISVCDTATGRPTGK